MHVSAAVVLGGLTVVFFVLLIAMLESSGMTTGAFGLLVDLKDEEWGDGTMLLMTLGGRYENNKFIFAEAVSWRLG